MERNKLMLYKAKRCGGRERPKKLSIYIKMEKNTIRMEK
jgi:hypothetical protein